MPHAPVMQVRVFFQEFTSEVTTQSVSGDLYTTLGSVGGIFGLFVGMSLITAMEFFEFAVAMLFAGVYKAAGCAGKARHGGARVASEVPGEQS